MSGQPSESRSAAIELQFQPAFFAPERAVASSKVWSGRWRSSVLPEAMSSHHWTAVDRKTRPQKVTGIDGYSWRKYHCVSVPVA